MALVRDWFPLWVVDHVGRFPTVARGWPEVGSEDFRATWGGLISWMIGQVPPVARGEADAASQALQVAAEPPRFRDEHVRRLRLLIERARADGAPVAAADALPKDFRDAADASASCPDCSGAGHAWRWHDTPREGRPGERGAAYFCLCTAGRWLANYYGQNPVRRARGPSGPPCADLANRPDLHLRPAEGGGFNNPRRYPPDLRWAAPGGVA